jgi:hypothetical protein
MASLSGQNGTGSWAERHDPLGALGRGQRLTDRSVGEFSPHVDTGLSPHDTPGAKR